MYDRILKRMQEKIRTRQYVMTLHAEEEMDDDELTIFDIERQKDNVTEEWKYVIEGQTIAGDKVAIVAKLSITGKLIIITVHLL